MNNLITNKLKNISTFISSNSMAKHYRSRLSVTTNKIEAEATLYMLSLLNLYQWDEPEDVEAKQPLSKSHD